MKGIMPASQPNSPEISKDIISSERLMHESPEYMLGWQSDHAQNISNYQEAHQEEGSIGSPRHHLIVLKDDFSQGHEYNSLLDLESPRTSRPSRQRSRLSVDPSGFVEISHYHAPSSPGNDSTGAQVEVAYLREQPTLVKPWGNESQIPVLSPTQQSTPPQSEDEFDGVRAIPVPPVWSPSREAEDDSSFQSTLDDEHEILTLKRNKAAGNSKRETPRENTNHPIEAKCISEKGMDDIIDLTDMADFGEEPARGGSDTIGQTEPTLQTLEALGLINGDTAELLNRSARLSRRGDDYSNQGDVLEIHEVPSTESALSGSSHESDDSGISDKPLSEYLVGDDERAEICESPEIPGDLKEDLSADSKEERTENAAVLVAADPPESKFEEEDVSLTNVDCAVCKAGLGESPTEQFLELSHELPAVAPHVTTSRASPKEFSMRSFEEEDPELRNSPTHMVERKSRDPPAASEVPENSDEESNDSRSRPASSPQGNVASADILASVEQEDYSEPDNCRLSDSETLKPTLISEFEQVETRDCLHDPNAAISDTARQNRSGSDPSPVPASEMEGTVAEPDIKRIDESESESVHDSEMRAIGVREQVDTVAVADAESVEYVSIPTNEDARQTTEMLPMKEYNEQPVSDSYPADIVQECTIRGSPESPADISGAMTQHSFENSQGQDEDGSFEEDTPHGTASIDSYYAEEKHANGSEREPAADALLSVPAATFDAPVVATPTRQTHAESDRRSEGTPSTLLAKAMSSLTLEDEPVIPTTPCINAIESTDEGSTKIPSPQTPIENCISQAVESSSAGTEREISKIENYAEVTRVKSTDKNGSKKIDPIFLANASLTECDSPVDNATVDSWKRVVDQAKDILSTPPLPKAVEAIDVPSSRNVREDNIATDANSVNEDASSTQSVDRPDTVHNDKSLDQPEDQSNLSSSHASPLSTSLETHGEKDATPTDLIPEESDQKSQSSESISREDQTDPLLLQSSSLAIEERSETHPSQTDSPSGRSCTSVVDEDSAENTITNNIICSEALSCELQEQTEETITDETERVCGDDTLIVKNIHISDKETSLEGQRTEKIDTTSSQAQVEVPEDVSCDFLERCCGKQAESPPLEVVKTGHGTDQSLQIRHNSIMDKLGGEEEMTETPSVTEKTGTDIFPLKLDQSNMVSANDESPKEESGTLASSPVGHSVEDNSVPTLITRVEQPAQIKKKEELSTTQTPPLSISEDSCTPVIRRHHDPQSPSGNVSLADSSITEVSRPLYDSASLSSQVFSPATPAYRRPSSSPSQVIGYQPRSLKDLLRNDLRSPDKVVVERALQQITIDCFYDQSARSLIARSGGLLSIIAAMEDHPDCWQIQVAGCQSLEKLALDEENEKAVSELGGIDCIMQAMKNHANNIRVQESAWSALQNLTCSNSLQETTFDKTEGGMLGLVQWFAKYADHCGVAMHASATLANLCIPNVTRTEQVVNADGVVLLAQALQRHWEDEDVRVEISHSLERLCDSIASRSV
jgi:hypothetical protein